MSRRGGRWGAQLLLFGLVLAAAPAAQGADEPPSVALSRLPEGVSGPELDGVMDDAAWSHATPIGALTQVIPEEGGAPSERTEVRIAYDRDFFYVGVRAFDREPDKLIAKTLRRDASQRSDDRFFCIIDTFHDHRNGYFFSTNPAGARYDGLIENNTRFRGEWDAIWMVKTARSAEGWSAEFAIPFKSISFDPENSTWGFNVTRAVRRRNEENRWASADQNRFSIDVAEAGNLTGIEGIEQGIGLDLVPALTARATELREDGTRRYSRLEPSFDLFYKITPSVTGALTFNTDFSDAPVDARQVNLTRFDLFFPETRDFFLQDAGIFDFGGLRQQNGIPFFSRRIGIGPDGQDVPLRAGVKTTGRVGGLNFGFLNVQMDDYPDFDDSTLVRLPKAIEDKNLTVVRAKWNILEESQAGFIFTHGEPGGNGSNTLFGGDVRLRTSRFRGGEIAQLDGWFQQSHTSGVSGSDEAFGLRFEIPNDRWNGRVGVTRIGENFDPALGFVNRAGIWQGIAELRRRWRPVGSPLRIVDVALNSALVTNLDGELESIRIEPKPIRLENHAGDWIELRALVQTERLFESFEIFEDVVLPAERYDFARGIVRLETANSRPLRLVSELGFGSFYSGRIRAWQTILEWRPSEHFFASVEWLQNAVRLDEGAFTTRIARVRADVAFNPDLTWSTFVQWDNVSDSMGWNSRLRWIVRPGEEIVLVWNQGVETLDRDFRSTLSDVALKVSWTFRY